MQILWPSATAFAVNSTAIAPVAPGRLSTITCRPGAGQLLPDNACRNVGAAASQTDHDNADRPDRKCLCGVRLGVCRLKQIRRGQQQRCERTETIAGIMHGTPLASRANCLARMKRSGIRGSAPRNTLRSLRATKFCVANHNSCGNRLHEVTGFVEHHRRFAECHCNSLAQPDRQHQL